MRAIQMAYAALMIGLSMLMAELSLLMSVSFAH